MGSTTQSRMAGSSVKISLDVVAPMVKRWDSQIWAFLGNRELAKQKVVQKTQHGLRPLFARSLRARLSPLLCYIPRNDLLPPRAAQEEGDSRIRDATEKGLRSWPLNLRICIRGNQSRNCPRGHTGSAGWNFGAIFLVPFALNVSMRLSHHS